MGTVVRHLAGTGDGRRRHHLLVPGPAAAGRRDLVSRFTIGEVDRAGGADDGDAGADEAALRGLRFMSFSCCGGRRMDSRCHRR
jgi:hypothetical protein